LNPLVFIYLRTDLALDLKFCRKTDCRESGPVSVAFARKDAMLTALISKPAISARSRLIITCELLKKNAKLSKSLRD